MRLGQISRKLNVKPSDIRDFIESEFMVRIELDLNFKLDDNQIAALNENFKLPEPIVVKDNNFASKIETVDTEGFSNEEAIIVDEIEPIIVEVEAPIAAAETEPILVEQDVIEITEQSQNTLPTQQKSSNVKDPFEPLPVNPDAELIKVPKIKLEGLKVIGKIELPEKIVAKPVNIEEISTDVEVADETVTNDITIENSEPSKSIEENVSVVIEEEYSIYKDKKGIYHFSQQQRESRKNRKVRVALKKSENQKKKNKAKHYQKIVKVVKKEGSEKLKSKTKKENIQQQKLAAVKPIRKGLWGKFLNWIND